MMKQSSESTWSPESWKGRLAAHQVVYEDRAAVEGAVKRLAVLPPLVSSFEIEKLKSHLAEAQEGKRFVLQGGDCAESIADCRDEVITAKLKILLQMSLVLVHGLKKPVVRIGRFAGQYSKPRSSRTETRAVDGREVTLPSYFGDLVNSPEFTPEARRPDPANMIRGYQHAAATLNFIRALIDGGFADLHHPEYWDLRFLQHAGMPVELRAEYSRLADELAHALKFMEILGETAIDELTRVEFFTSHEGLNLLYETAHTRRVPRRHGWYNLTTHLPWIGERTRAIDGAHVEFFRGIANPVGVKIGPAATADEVLRLIEVLNPADEPGKLVLIHRMGAREIGKGLAPILNAVASSKKRVLWLCDPMHGNTTALPPSLAHPAGLKTRRFEHVVAELESAFEIHARAGTVLAGVHVELTGEDVTECLGGAAGITEADLATNYASVCDPRLNYSQAMELAFRIAGR
ncbi:MAG TPA: 3-deoxy-7-phosphoheptulonate synthase class II [Phycisphaerales bacterium]|nr:3-deoxy-7-phosphoheptulonate synthase class II [Phycisphaerales bacterium]